MIAYDDKTWQTSSAAPDTDFVTWEETRTYWVIPDSSELAQKIRSTPNFEYVLDEDGNLVDINETPIPETYQLYSQIDELKREAEALDLQAVRPLRAIAAGTATDEDREFLESNERRVSEIREMISQLQTQIQAEEEGTPVPED